MRKWSQKEISPQITSRLLLERKPLLCWKGACTFPSLFQDEGSEYGYRHWLWYTTGMSSEQMAFPLEQSGHVHVAPWSWCLQSLTLQTPLHPVWSWLTHLPHGMGPDRSIPQRLVSSTSVLGCCLYPLQALHGIFWELSLGQRDPRGDCVMVSIPWRITCLQEWHPPFHDAGAGWGLSLRKGRCHAAPQLVPSGVQSPAAPDLLQRTRGWRVQSWELS